jgi:hypothetical protein
MAICNEAERDLDGTGRGLLKNISAASASKN